MDIKDEDISEESKKNHIRYYKSLSKVISDIENEKNDEISYIHTIRFRCDFFILFQVFGYGLCVFPKTKFYLVVAS